MAHPPGNWFYVSAIERVYGWLPERVVIARPILPESIEEWKKRVTLEEYVIYRCRRSRIEPEYIET